MAGALVGGAGPDGDQRADRAKTSGRRDLIGARGGQITAAVLRDATHRDEVVTALGYEPLRRNDCQLRL